MKRLRGRSKTEWAIAISGLLWVPILIFSVWLTLRPPLVAGELFDFGPILMSLAFVGLAATFAILWLVFTVVQWLRKSTSSRS